MLIECCQFVFGTGVSEEDLILNTVGAAMGYGLYCVGLGCGNGIIIAVDIFTPL